MQGPPPFGLNESDVQMAFSAKQGFNLPLKQTDALWELFLPKIGKFVKTAVLTLGMDILTMTTPKARRRLRGDLQAGRLKQMYYPHLDYYRIWTTPNWTYPNLTKLPF